MIQWSLQAGLKPAAHHRLLLRELSDPSVKRLMVMMPPGSAKSTYGSKIFPPYLFANIPDLVTTPDLNVLGVSHTQMLANTFSRDVQKYIREHTRFLGYHLTTENADKWSTSNGGTYRASGVLGGITGFRADVAILDDPIKGREEAESELQREKIWHWYWTDLNTRMRPGNRIIIINTRWHEDDLCGRLLLSEPEKWRVIRLAARAPAEGDPLGRAPGEYLWSDDAYGYGDLLAETYASYESNGASRDWNALYDQNPLPGEGAIFKAERIQILEEYPNTRNANIARGWDLAATEQVGTLNPDWTVGVKLARLPDRRFVILDAWRFRGGPHDVVAGIKAVSAQDGAAVKIGLPQDPAQAGKFQAQFLVGQLSGHDVRVSPELGDKAYRAMPVAAQVNAGNVAMVRAPWNGWLLAELAGFPSAAKDDAVDALSRAFSVVGLGPAPYTIDPRVAADLGRTRPT